MTMKKCIGVSAILFALILAGSELRAVTIQWQIKKGDRLEMVKTAKVKHYVNGQLSLEYEERDIVNLTCYEEGPGSSKVKGDFSIFQRENPGDVFENKEVLLKTHDSDFIIQSTGRFKVKKEDYMPNLRHIPSFPTGEVKKGDTWKGEAEMLFDNFSAPFRLVFDAEYTLKEVKKDGDDDIAVVQYKFQFSKNADAKSPADFPKIVAGKNAGVFQWNLTKKTPGIMDDQYKIIFVFQEPGKYSGQMSQEFHMNIHTENKTYRVLSDQEKEKERDELAKEIAKDSDIEVTADKRGLVLTMGDVHFDFDSYQLKEKSREKLNGVTAIIAKKYPDHELLVEGHTDSTGNPDYNQKLSEKRALAVAKYLKQNMGHDKISYQGFGDKKPVAPNATAEGKQKNRRVEIVIRLD